MSSNRHSGGPLGGIKVLDFTWFGVGPYSTLMFSFMGADCVRVESAMRPDVSRHGTGKPDMLGRTFGSFSELATNKDSIRVNLKHPDAAELVLSLVEHFDVVAESFRPGVMDRLGIGYSQLTQRRPDLIMLSSSAHGADGPDAGFAGYAPIFAALGGLGYISGYEGGPPMEIRHSMDMVSGLMCVFAVLTALMERRRSGRGQHIDIAARETASHLMGHAFTQFSLTGEDPERRGNSDAPHTPHNCYPCKGTDRWISIAVRDDAHWRGLLEAMGRPPWAEAQDLGDGYGRWLRRNEVDRRIAEWTRRLDVQKLWKLLQRHGVPSSPSMDGQQLLEDQHLATRKAFLPISHDGKNYFAVGPPFKFSETPRRSHHAPEPMGAQTRSILGDLLGISGRQIDSMEMKGLLA